jgi:hypothetical protein
MSTYKIELFNYTNFNEMDSLSQITIQNLKRRLYNVNVKLRLTKPKHTVITQRKIEIKVQK